MARIISFEGRRISVPDDATDDEVAGLIQAQSSQTQSPPQADAPNTAIDMARSIPGGLAKGAAAIAGLPGDIASLGQPEEPPASTVLGRIRQFTSPANLIPTSKGIADTLAAPFGGFYEPKTYAGRVTEAAASFAPAALAPGSLATRVARVAAPTAGSQAGELPGIKGTPLQPYASTIGALAAGGAQGLGEGIMAERLARASVPSGTQLKASSGAMYRDMEAKNLNIAGRSYDNAIDQIASDLSSAGINSRVPATAQARLYPKASAALEVLQQSKGADIGLADLDKLRQTARIALESNDKADRRIAHVIIDGLDDFVNKLKPGDLVSGDPAAVASLNEARALWQKAAKSDTIDRVIAKADASKGQFTGAGYENALRVQFRALAKNERAMRQFSPTEQAAIRKVEAGGPIGNLMRFIGKYSPHGSIATMMTGGAGYAVGGPVGAVAALGAGETARQAATFATSRNARRASEIVRGGTASGQLAQPVIKSIASTAALSSSVARNDYADRLMSAQSAQQQQ